MVVETTIRVRYAETDTMGVVYYGNYLTYFEVGRVEFLRQHGFPMSAVDRKVHMPVVEASVRYVQARAARRPAPGAVLDQRAEARVVRLPLRHPPRGDGRSRRDDGETRHACWNPETQRMIAIPDWLEPPRSEPEPCVWLP